MYKDGNRRSLAKGVSWRFFATSTTIIIVFVFFGRVDLAIAAGMVETVAKVILYWIHERIWLDIRWGRKRIEPFCLWFTGLPLSGKTTVADRVFSELKKNDIPIERLDSKDIRDLIPDIGYTRQDRNRHLLRVAHLIRTLQKNSISTVASFVSPYEETRKTIKKMARNCLVVYLQADIDTCRARDYKGVYKKADAGELIRFTGITDVYEEPTEADIVIDTREIPVDKAVEIILEEIAQRRLF
jgi:adenylylsulfate kinase